MENNNMNTSKSIRINGYNERMINVLKAHQGEAIPVSTIIKEMACGIQTAAAYTTINRLVTHGIVVRTNADKVNVYALATEADALIHHFKTQFDGQKEATKARQAAIKAEEKALRLKLKAERKEAKEAQDKADRELRLKIRHEEKAARLALKPIKVPQEVKVAAKKVVAPVEKKETKKTAKA